MSRQLARRHVLAGGCAGLLGACQAAQSRTVVSGLQAVPLKSLAPFAIGTCVQDLQLLDPVFVGLLTRHFSQVTPEWEMKMEYVVLPNGDLRFDRGDRLAALLRQHGMRLHGTSLVWYAQKPVAFERFDTARATFGQAYDTYIATLVGRYRDIASGWDVVNEPVAEEGDGWRASLWADRLGPFDHMVRAFHVAHQAHPQAVGFINDYNLESKPRKLDTYLRLIEQLLKAGAPVGGIGVQAHVSVDLPAGALTRAIQAVARFGLPLHVSEMDVSVGTGWAMRREERWALQARLYGEAMQAFADLPARQQYGFSVWGVRDQDSWLRGQPGLADDSPLLFDELGQPKPAFYALADALG